MNDTDRKIYGGILFFLISLSVFFRIWHLENLPGINGDEARYGVQVMGMLSGQEYTLFHGFGRPINPFYSGILLVLHLFFSPRFVLLRIPALISGLLFLLVAFFLLKKIFKPFTASLCLVLFATLPVNIAYSRFGWEPAQIPLFILITLYFGWKKSWRVCFFFFLCSVFVHPTCLFLFPVLLGMAFFPEVVEKRKISPVKILLPSGVVICLGAVFVYFMPVVQSTFKVSLFARRLLDLHQWMGYLVYLGRLFSGETLYEYMVERPPFAIGVQDFCFWALMSFAFFRGVKSLYHQKDWSRLGFILGIFPSGFFLYIAGGVGQSVAPGAERYSLFLVVPVVMAFCFCLETQINSQKDRRVWAVFICSLAFFFLISFYVRYFQPLETTGSLTERAFYTGSIEPKEKAFQTILQQRKGEESLVILTEDFWLYTPLKYLSFGEKGVEVLWIQDVKGKNFWTLHSKMKKSAYAVGFDEISSSSHQPGPFRQVMESLLKRQPMRQWKIRGYSGRVVLRIWQMEGKGHR